jgi:spermidine/putrescine transport system permease protein
VATRSLRRRFLGWLSERPGWTGWLLVGPGLLWMLLLFVLPLAWMLSTSLHPRGIYGGVAEGWTAEHYRRLFEPIYLTIFLRTVAHALACTALCLVIGYPLAWVMARAGRWRNLMVLLVMLPFWTSFLVRTFALIFLMRDSGLVNSVLLGLGVIDEPLALLYTPGAVQLGLVYGLLPFMVLPLYTSLEKLDTSLLEAAEVLGARPAARFFRVMLPLSLPGVLAGSLLVFVPALGMYLSSDLLGGAKQMLVGNLVQNQFTAARNWPFGAAASLLLMVTVVLTSVSILRLRTRGVDL